MSRPTLHVICGLPATGKSTIASAIAAKAKLPFVRVDTIEHHIALAACGGGSAAPIGPSGYTVAYTVAADNLALGISVVVECVNPLEVTRQAWRDVANTAGADFVELEVTCSNPQEHRRRAEVRSVVIAGDTGTFRAPSWDEIERYEYKSWTDEHGVIDTAGRTPQESIADARAILFPVPAHPLDDPIRNSLDGALSRFAIRRGRIMRADPEVSPFLVHPDDLDAQDWEDIAALFGPRTVVALNGPERALPEGWSRVETFGLVQLVGTHLETRRFDDAVELTAADVPEMLDLVRRTEPGPFLPRTIELGTYLGVRRHGALVAMAGERMHPPGWTEISAVCTDPAFRGQGLATDLVRAVGQGIRDRGEEPFLHASAANVRAIDLYLSIGFELRRTTQLTLVRTPA